MLGEGEVAEHDDGLDDVLVDLEALFLRKGAPGHREVVQLSLVIEQFGHGHAEAPGVVWRDAVLRATVEAVLRLVGQERFEIGTSASAWRRSMAPTSNGLGSR